MKTVPGAASSPALPRGGRVAQTERVITYIRISVVIFNAVTFWAWGTGSERDAAALWVLGIAAAYAAVTYLWRPDASTSRSYAWASTVADNVLIGAWIYATGGYGSPYFPLFYAEAAASVGRFGLPLGGVAAAGSAAAYLLVVLVDGGGPAYGLTVRLAYTFVIGAFVAYIAEVARRSERVAIAAERERAVRQELENLRSGFITNISHELRTPLAAIRGAASTLVHKGDSLSRTESLALLEMIDRQSQGLATIVQDIIDVGLIDQGRSEPHFEMTELRSLISGEIEKIRTSTNGRVDLDAPSVEVDAFVDGGKLAMALRKILDNAAKFSLGDSTLRVVLEEPLDGEVHITVQGAGAELDSALSPDIFEQIQKDPAHTTDAGGAVLGLSVARAIVELHGGRVLSGSRGPGSFFEVVIPVGGPSPVPSSRGSRSL